MTTLDALVSRARPEAIAVRQGEATLTYAELLGRAGALARKLVARGAGPEKLVGVSVDRHTGLPVALLGVLMSGAAYVPMDPSLPPQRLSELARDVDLVVDESMLLDAMAEPPPQKAPPQKALPGNAAYVIHTSGSTGRPKGVVIPHSAVVAFVRSTIELTGIDQTDRALAFAAIGFDVSVLELFVPLAAGATVCLVPTESRKDSQELQRFCEQHEVSWASISPVLLPLLDPAGFPRLRVLMTGDEPPGPEQVARWAAPGRRFLNCYGPTEATVQVCAFEAGTAHEGALPIGRAIGGHTLQIGGDGELTVGGPGLARGYLNDAAATAKAFVPGPDGARLYRTGDLASLGDDGLLRFHGRADRQVKIRGQRVEAGEAESVLRGHSGITHAVVEIEPGPALHAYVQSSSLDADAIREWCAARLPVVPDRITIIGEFPVTASHKVDREALRDPLARLWEREIGEAALQSIAAMRLAAAIRAVLGKDVSAADIFAGWDLDGLRPRVEAAPALERKGPITGNRPMLTAAQKRLWFVDQLAPDSAAYNIAMAQRIRGPLDIPRLERALARVAARHEVLRWRIPHRAGEPYVEVDPPRPITLHRTASPEQAAHRFDLATGPLWKAWLTHDNVLVIAAHHAIFDGWSEDLLYKDLRRAYETDRDLEPLATQFGDYAAWREAQPETLPWWLDHLKGAPAVLRLPTDFPRPAVQTYRGAIVRARIEPAETQTLLARWARLMATLSNQDTVIIGAPVADRRLTEFAPLIGFFVDIVPLRIDGALSLPFADLVAACGEEMLAALANPAAPLDDIIAGLGLPRDASRHPLVQSLFNVFNFAPPVLTLDDLAVEPVRLGVPGSPFDLTAYLTAPTEVEIVYNPDLFGEARMRALIDAWAVGDPPPAWLRTGVAEAPRRDLPGRSPEAGLAAAVAEVWREVLGHNDFGMDSNFFEAGGRSLALARVQARLAALGHNVSLVELFRLPTVRSQAAHLEQPQSGHETGDERLERAAARAAARAQAMRRRRSND